MRKINWCFITLLIFGSSFAFAGMKEVLSGKMTLSHTSKSPQVSTLSVLETVVFQKLFSIAKDKILEHFGSDWHLSEWVQAYKILNVRSQDNTIAYAFEITWTPKAEKLFSHDTKVLEHQALEIIPYMVEVGPVLSKSLSYPVETFLMHIQKHLLIREFDLELENHTRILAAMPTVLLSSLNKHLPCKRHPGYLKLLFKHHSRKEGALNISWVSCPETKPTLLHETAFLHEGVKRGQWGKALYTAILTALRGRPTVTEEESIYQTVQFKGLISYGNFLELEKQMSTFLNLPFIQGFNLHKLSYSGPSYRIETTTFDQPEQAGFKDTLSRMCQRAKWICSISFVPDTRTWEISLAIAPD